MFWLQSQQNQKKLSISPTGHRSLITSHERLEVRSFKVPQARWAEEDEKLNQMLEEQDGSQLMESWKVRSF